MSKFDSVGPRHDDHWKQLAALKSEVNKSHHQLLKQVHQGVLQPAVTCVIAIVFCDCMCTDVVNIVNKE